MKPTLNVVNESLVMDNFKKLQNFIESNIFLKSDLVYKHYIIENLSAGEPVRIPLRLKSTPKDVLVTNTTGISFTIDYETLDKSGFEIIPQATGTVRAGFLIGRFVN